MEATLAKTLEGWEEKDLMYRFKVELCTNEAAHDWLECPFAHRGEKAARRDPQLHNHVAVICPDIRRNGRCPRGDNCPYAHSVFELHLHPARFRTQLCTMGASCRRPVCFFAHTLAELRAVEEQAPAAATTAPLAPAPPPPRGLSFDLAADGGAAAAFAIRAAAAQPGAGRASLETAAGKAAALSTTSYGALSGPLATLGGTPVRPPATRTSFDAIAPSRLAALADKDMRRLSLPSLLPAELGFTATDEGGSPAAQAADPVDLGAASWFVSSAHHPQQVRAAIALLEQNNKAVAAGRGGRRGGLDGGSRLPALSAASEAPWAAPAAPPTQGVLPSLDAEQQQMLSALLVQQQCELFAQQQCEQLAAQHRERVAGQQQKQQANQAAPTQQQQQQQQELLAQQRLLQHLSTAQRPSQQLQQQLTAPQSRPSQPDQQHIAALSSLWLQERCAAAAAAAAVAAAQHESNTLAAMHRLVLAMHQQDQQQAHQQAQQSNANTGAWAAGTGAEVTPLSGAAPGFMSAACQLSLLQTQLS